jgi:hypothetical protein
MVYLEMGFRNVEKMEGFQLGLDCSTNILMSLMYECDKRYTKEILTRDMKSS